MESVLEGGVGKDGHFSMRADLGTQMLSSGISQRHAADRDVEP
jgi:hypothetical protein